MIVRNEAGYIGQQDPNDPSYLDFGDCSARTGIMALSGSAQDVGLLPTFVTIGEGLVRCPVDEQWDDVLKTSRDQVVQFAAGCWQNAPAVSRSLQQQYTWHINGDVIMPDVRNHLRLCAGLPPTFFGLLWLNLSILFQAKFTPTAEINQLMSMCIVAGSAYTKKLCAAMPNWEANIATYWGNDTTFRYQAEIGAAFITRIKKDLAV